MHRPLLLVALLFCLPSIALAGPNAGGTIIAVDPDYVYTIDNSTFCDLGSVPSSCASADVELDGSGRTDIRIWKVYAAFWPESQPRLKGINFGIHYPTGGSGIFIKSAGPCNSDPNKGGIELPGIGWPATDTGTSVVFDHTLTGLLEEIYWFAGYTGSAGAHNLFELRSDPDPGHGGGNFGDDSTPSNLDPIAGYGSLGFDTPGAVSCPIAPGACCNADGSCTLTWQNECQPPSTWNGGPTCNPNPCPPPSGACCYPDGHCEYVLSTQCPTGDWLMNVPCDPNPCTQPKGACCYPDGHCVVTTQANCTTGDWRGGVPCVPNPCPPPTPTRTTSWGRVKTGYR